MTLFPRDGRLEKTSKIKQAGQLSKFELSYDDIEKI
jgi:hypothetical protein